MFLCALGVEFDYQFEQCHWIAIRSLELYLVHANRLAPYYATALRVCIKLLILFNVLTSPTFICPIGPRTYNINYEMRVYYIPNAF